VIGPGWMPSRPRPLGRPRRTLLWYTVLPRTRRRQTPRPRSATAAARCDLFGANLEAPAGLPTATLRRTASQARHRVLGGYLKGWIASHWAWLRPRTVPMLVAIAGMFAVLRATGYLSDLAHGDPRPTVYAPARARAEADQPRCAGARTPAAVTRAAPGDKRHIAPVRPGSRDVTIQLGP
jgi:hypothetical protein